MRDIRRPEELVRLHLANAEFDLSHQQAVHPGQARAVLGKHELAVEVEIGARERGTIIGPHVLEQLSMHGESGDRHCGVSGEIAQRGLFENDAIGIKILDVVSAELWNLRSVMRPSRQQPLAYQTLKGGFRGRASDAVALGNC